jgi:hypothetical protein
MPMPDPDRILAVFAGMPCTNRETAAEKAAAHEWMEKERARRLPRNLRTLEKLRRAFAEFEAARRAKSQR